MKPQALILARYVALGLAAIMMLSAMTMICFADSGDVTESYSMLVDADNDGTAETFVVWKALAGDAYFDNWSGGHCPPRQYYFTCVYNSPPDGVVRIAIWFVDATAPGFVSTNSATWTYKSVPGVSLYSTFDSSEHCGTNAPYYGRVIAYTERNQSGTVVGTSDGYHADFTNSAVGIKEIYARSSYANNNIDCFIIRSATAGAALSVSPSALTPSCTVGQDAASQSFDVWNSGSAGSFMYTIREGISWLSCTPTNGTSGLGHQTITVNYSTAGLAAGTYNGTITVTAPGASGSPQTISVTLTVNPTVPQLSVSPTTLTPSCTAGQDAASGSFQVWNSGGGSMSYTVSEAISWLSCTPTSGTSTGGHDTISVNYTTAALAAGTYSGTITVTAPGAGGSPQTVNVTLTVNPSPQLSVNPSLLTPICIAGQDAASQSFDVWNSGGGSLSYTVGENISWLSCTPTNGTSSGEHHSIAVNYTTAGLAAGTYNGTITVTAAGASGSPQTINVTLRVSSGMLISAHITTSNTMSASWTGGAGTWLEQSLRLDSPDWVRVPGSEGACYMEVPLTNSAAFFRVAAIKQPIIITQQPGSLAVAQGNQATFSVAATGTPPLAYQWRFNGTNISGAINTTYSIGSVQPSHVGDYTVVVSYGSDAVTSSPATLVILAPSGHLVWVPAGTFVMGSPNLEVDRDADEGPQTTVTISQGFWMGTYEVTQQEYTNLMGSNPSYFTSSLDQPVEFLSWDDATNYCGTLTQSERASGRIPANYAYRLPTEAEWEYACRAGTTTRFSYGDDPGYTTLTAYAWYSDNSGNTTHPVGGKLPNPWGLYDMYGNVWEFCRDWYTNSYSGGSVTNPVGPGTGTLRVLRGGSYYYVGKTCRSANRGAMEEIGTRYDAGLRAVLARTGP